MTSYAGRGVHGQVVEHLGYRLVSGEVAEGDTLDPRALAREWDLSLTVIRESLKVLAGKGLVAARQKRGTFVRARGEWNMLDADVIRWRVAAGKGESLLRDLGELRMIVEPAAVRHAAERRTDEDLSALERALTAMGQAGDDAAEAAAADVAFHRALLTASGNEMLARLDQLMEPVLHARDSIVHAPHGVADDPVPSHRAVLEAVRARDADRASAAMADLLTKADADAGLAVRDLAGGRGVARPEG
ncbi:FadR/GntR family transcriptional regulator [Streptomyces daliensis]